MDTLPNKVLLQIFSYLPHKEILKSAQVCKKWRAIAYDPRLWKAVSLRPSYGGLEFARIVLAFVSEEAIRRINYVGVDVRDDFGGILFLISSIEALLALISVRFGPSLNLIELQTDQITAPVLHDLAAKCPNLQYLTLDFSNAAQLHDFSELQSFPSHLRSLTICLSENIFLEGFLRKVYSFIGTLEVLHIIGTFEKWEDEEEEVYETININKFKSFTPNLRVMNLWGVPFLTDEHIESIAASLPLLECLSFNFCQAVTGSCLKQLLQRCKRLRSLHMEQTTLNSKHVIAAEWENTSIEELNIAATDVSSECLTSILTRLPNIRWLSASVLEHFTDQVLDSWMKSGNCSKLVAIDLDTCDMLSDGALTEFIKRHGHQLTGLNLGGNEKLLEQFWLNVLPMMPSLELLIMGMAEDCCPKVKVKIHIDQLMDCICQHLPKIKELEIRWDSDKLRFSDKSSKFIDLLRMKCLCLQSLVLSDGEYCEVVHSNFERADREMVVKTTAHCQTTLVPLLKYYSDLLFN
ncbi:F-box-like domain containing protein [Trichuris trichiura]|uniref:F-box-like domain containing protein n=1 Tax=Trichuris trichiura TaxID=36087 RepID=A0A077ZFM3_TRITR|nr:F-box-like domain containing protein [Trichuris trichiura]